MNIDIYINQVLSKPGLSFLCILNKKETYRFEEIKKPVIIPHKL